MANLRIDEAYLVGSWCSAALWGIFSFLLIIAVVQIVQLYTQGNMSRSKWLTSAAITLLYCLATAHTSMELRRIIIGLVNIQGPGTRPYFADDGQNLNIAKDIIYVTSIILADIIVCWRCYVVWQSNKYVLWILTALLLGTATAGYGAMAQYFLPITANVREAISFGFALYAISLATNVVTTILTVGRIWWQARVLTRALGRAYHQSTYRTLLLILIESGLLIAVAKVIEFVLYKVAPDDGDDPTGDNGLYVIFDMIPQINGIVPALITITVNAKMTITDVQTFAATNTFKDNGPVGQASTMVFSGPAGRGQVTSGNSVFMMFKSDDRNEKSNTVTEDVPLEAQGDSTGDHSDGSSNV